jgi:ABC-type uncharacterized transport system permease subunit
MITNLLIDLVSGVFSFFNALLPSVSVPSWFTTNAASSITTKVGNLLAGMSGVIPINAFLTVLQEMLTFLPLALAYLIFDWAWGHCPTIAGCGT